MLALVLENDGSSPTAGLLILFIFLILFYFLFLYFYYILFISLFFIHYYFFYYFTWNGPKMFVDLDWPTNASSPLSASAELLVIIGYSVEKRMGLISRSGLYLSSMVEIKLKCCVVPSTDVFADPQTCPRPPTRLASRYHFIIITRILL